MTNSQKALIIKIDGVDGCGKTTLIREIAKVFDPDLKIFISAEFGSKHDVTVDFNSETVSLSKMLKGVALDPIYAFDDIERELLWAIISRRHNRKILPELESKADIVLVDRSDFGNFAYGKTLDKNICHVFNLYTAPLSRQDWIFWLDTPLHVCQERLGGNRLDSVEGKGYFFFQKVYEQYSELCASTKNASRIDGSLDLDAQVAIVRAKIESLREAAKFK